MSDKQREAISWWMEVVFKVGTPLSVALVGAVILWLNANYATRAELRDVSNQVAGLREMLIRLEEGKRTDERHEQALHDLDGRVRALEARR